MRRHFYFCSWENHKHTVANCDVAHEIQFAIVYSNIEATKTAQKYSINKEKNSTKMNGNKICIQKWEVRRHADTRTQLYLFAVVVMKIELLTTQFVNEWWFRVCPTHSYEPIGINDNINNRLTINQTISERITVTEFASHFDRMTNP